RRSSCLPPRALRPPPPSTFWSPRSPFPSALGVARLSVRLLPPGACAMAFPERDARFAEYVIVRPLGARRVAAVYEVSAPSGEHPALTVINPGLAPMSKPQLRLGQEGEAVAAIEHVNVVRFHDGGIEDGRVFLVVELVPGPDLRRLVHAAGGRLPV